jgi:hypothetical protein
LSDQYDFGWSIASKPVFTVQPQTKDTTSTSLVLTGRGSPNWGRDLQQNLIKMLESFASPTPPANGVTGQVWYDTTNKVLHVYDASVDPLNAWAGTAGGGVSSGATAPNNPKPGTLWYDTVNSALKIWHTNSWIQIFPIPNTLAEKVAFVTEYNEMITTINKIIGAPTGTTLATAFGYGQTDVFAAETVNTMTNAKWVALLTKIRSLCIFLGIDYSDLALDGFIYEQGNAIPYGVVTMLAKYNATLAAIDAMIASTTRFKPVPASLESSTPASGTTSRSTTWTGTITHDVIATFSDATAVKAFLNAGGQFQFVGTETNPGTLRDVQWRDFLANIGTVKFTATGSVDSQNRANSKGFYDLTTTYQPIFAVANPNNAQQVFTINARLENSGRAIRFQRVYSDPGTLYGGVGGTLTSATTIVRANSTVLKVPVLAYPTVTQTALA